MSMVVTKCCSDKHEQILGLGLSAAKIMSRRQYFTGYGHTKPIKGSICPLGQQDTRSHCVLCVATVYFHTPGTVTDPAVCPAIAINLCVVSRLTAARSQPARPPDRARMELQPREAGGL